MSTNVDGYCSSGDAKDGNENNQYCLVLRDNVECDSGCRTKMACRIEPVTWKKVNKSELGTPFLNNANHNDIHRLNQRDDTRFHPDPTESNCLALDIGLLGMIMMLMMISPNYCVVASNNPDE
ncbi:hypothetical protein LXL04_004507 [Taraxacum kok-saghyz]